MRRVAWVALIGWLCAACSTRAGQGERDAAASPLAGSLQIEVEGDSTLLTLHATNPGTRPVRLEFATAQRYDFEVWTLGGERLWRWSDGQAFAQVASEAELAPGGSLRERVRWPGSGAPGEYVAVARLLMSGSPLELRARFRVPAE